MALNPSGQISLGGANAGESINLELSQTAAQTISLNDAAVRTLAGVPSGVISMPTDFWGKSTGPVGTAYWTAYAGYHYDPIPSASAGYKTTYNGANTHCMISSTGDLITIGIRESNANPPPSSDFDLAWRKWNSTGVYQSQYHWGNNFPNRNGMTMQGVHLNRARTSMAVHFNSGTGNPLGAPPAKTVMDTNFNRGTETQQHPSGNLATISFSANASYAPNGNVLWTGGANPSPVTNFGYGISPVTSTGMTLRRLPSQTGAGNLNIGITGGTAVTSDPSSNFYALTRAETATTNYNWWKFDGSGNVIGQVTTSAIGYSGVVSADANDSGTTFATIGTGTSGIPVFAINSGGSILWSTLITESPAAGGAAVLYIRFDHTNNKVILFAQYTAHSVDGCVLYIIWLNPTTGAITLQRKLKGQVSFPTVNKPDVFLDRILLTVKSGVWNTGFNGPAPAGSIPLVINPLNIISLPAPGGAIGTAVGYQNTLTYSATTQFSNSPLSVTTSPNGLSGFASPGGGPQFYGLYPTNFDYAVHIDERGSWSN